MQIHKIATKKKLQQFICNEIEDYNNIFFSSGSIFENITSALKVFKNKKISLVDDRNFTSKFNTNKYQLLKKKNILKNNYFFSIKKCCKLKDRFIMFLGIANDMHFASINNKTLPSFINTEKNFFFENRFIGKFPNRISLSLQFISKADKIFFILIKKKKFFIQNKRFFYRQNHFKILRKMHGKKINFLVVN